MASHIYLVASLPTLMPDRAPSLSLAEYLEICQRHVTPFEFDQLVGARIDDHETPAGTPTYGAWRDFDGDLREQLLVLRALALGWDAASFTRRDRPVPVTEPVRAAFEEPDPLLAEQAVFRLRWKFLDELDRAHFMRSENLIVYGLKLQLIEQLLAASQERGQRKLDEIRCSFAATLPDWATE